VPLLFGARSTLIAVAVVLLSVQVKSISVVDGDWSTRFVGAAGGATCVAADTALL
jgi:hypothetical protein